MQTQQPRTMRSFLRFSLYATALAVLAGCGESGPPMGKVTGKVTYADGSIPQGGVAVIRFEVAKDSTAEKRKAADSDIQSDGSYSITTMKPGDGAFYGKYKVVFTIFKSYRDNTSLVAKEFMSADTTPYEIVIDSPSQTVDYTVEKP